MRVLPYCLLLLFAVVQHSCSKKTTALSDPAAYQAYVSGYTGAVISRTSPVVVSFTAPYGEQREGEPIPSQLLSLSPSVAGTLEWADPFTLHFIPKEALPHGTAFTATLQLNRLVTGLPDSLQQFVFQFKTRDQFLRLTVDELTIPEESQPNAFALSGTLYSNDFAVAETLEKSLQVEAGGQKPTITWTHESEGTVHRFRIFPVQAGQKEIKIQLRWDGNALGVDQKGSEEILIPSTLNFQVMSCKANQGSQSEIRLSFSQLLDKNQDLTGLIYLSSAPDLSSRFLIEGNRVICYFSQRLEGPHTLQIRQSLVNHHGKKLDQPFTQSLNFTQAMPALRLAGTGNIIPNAGELYFPFEAINLQAVEVEIFKIHAANILQFLQVNELNGDYELHRVGVKMWSGKVDLNALNPERNQHEFVQYALDLARLIEPDPQSLYQVRIGFWKEYSTYGCDEESEAPLAGAEAGMDEEEDYGYYSSEEEESSLMHFYYGRKGFHRNYRWENRDNPCAEEYYNSDRFISRNILASNLGITAKRSESGDVLLVATDLRTADPIGDAEVTFYNYQMQSILKGKTNSDGIYQGNLAQKIEFAVVRKGREAGYLVLKEYQALTTSDFPTEGTAVQKGLRGFTYAERGVWRPGDSIFLNLVLYDPGNSLPANYPVTLELADPRGRQVLRRVNGTPAGNVYGFHLATMDDAPTGVWHARFLAGGAVFHHYLRIETIKPNRYKLALDFSKERLGRQDEPLSATMRANWLHGAPAPNQETQIDARVVSVPTVFKGYESYRFDHPELDRIDQAMTWVKGQTNEEGIFSIQKKPLVQEVTAPGLLRVDFKFRVNEPGGGFSQDFLSLPYDPYAYYAGIQIPKNAQGVPQFDTQQNVTLRFASIQANGKPASGRKLEVRIIRKEWRWWWERYRDNRTYTNQAEVGEIVQSTNLFTDANGMAQWAVSFEDYNRFQILVCDPASGHCSGEDIYIFNSQKPEIARELRYFAFKTDKEVVAPGGEVQVELPPGKGGQALVSVETSSRILEAKLVPLSDKVITHRIKVTDKMSPNFYVHVSLLQPHQRGNDLPLRMYGIQPVTVEDPSTLLHPVLSAPKEMRPDQSYTFSVSEKNKKGMSYTLALVDEGLLDLTQFKTPNPHKSLFSKEALGVKTWDVFDQVLGGFAGDLRRIVSIGGDGSAAKPDGNPKANRFKPAIVHIGPFYLAPGKTAKHEIVLPNYVGSVRAMVVASSDQAFGNTEQTIPVRKPLMTAATLPRQLGIGERLDLAVTVFAMDSKVKEATITVTEKSGLVKFLNARSTQTVRFSKPGEHTIYFPIETTDRSGVAQFTIEANGNGETARQTMEIAVRNPNPLQTMTYEALLKPGESHTFNYPLTGTPGTNEAVLYAMSLPPLNLESQLNHLMNYPFGCLEQTTSSIFPLVFLPQIMDLPEGAVRDMRDRIGQGIRRIISMKDGQGRLLYWPEGQYHHPWSEVYAVLFLAIAREAGYTVPDAAWKQIVAYQKSQANQWDAADRSLQAYGVFTQSLQAFRLYTLAVAQDAPLGALNRLRERADLTDLDKWLLAAAYAKSGKSDIAKRITTSLGREVPQYRDSRYTFGSDVRDQAIICMALQEMGDRPGAFQILRVIAARLNTNNWYSTHSIAMGLWAYSVYAKGTSGKKDFSLVYAVENGDRKQLGSSKPLVKQVFTPASVHRKAMKVDNTGSDELFVQFSLTGRPPMGGESESEKGISLSTRYVQMDGKPLNIERLPLGTDFFAIAEVRHIGATDQMITEVALNQSIPAGWEIRNTRMPAESVTVMPPMIYKYRDIRDDRANTFFDLKKVRNAQGQVISQVYHLALTAAYPGRYYLPAQQAEAMYDPNFSATTSGRWIEVFDPGRDKENQ